ncbi:hypothetical protein LshimejAT787_0310000 [Lyophyllum shimeji]|uniref:Uncharacterized protein n=1 Tax=Lyophyllum shimeji TaxID=47721 RepID=A0A9P3UKI8_LYOSH|nr:hypothetical protein LshimejAT787_0310000 [Lyophyllum shimeji]
MRRQGTCRDNKASALDPKSPSSNKTGMDPISRINRVGSGAIRESKGGVLAPGWSRSWTQRNEGTPNTISFPPTMALLSGGH